MKYLKWLLLFCYAFQFHIICFCVFCMLKRIIFIFMGVSCCLPICHVCLCLFVCHVFLCCVFVFFCLFGETDNIHNMGVSCCLPICHHMIISLDDCSLVTFHYYMPIFLYIPLYISITTCIYFYTFLYIFLMCLYRNIYRNVY